MSKEYADKKSDKTDEIIKEKKHNSQKKYFGYLERLILSAVFAVLFLVAAVIFALNSFNLESEKLINYRETSNLDYKVYLKPNEFYEDEYLGKNMVYVAGLIDKINVDFNYVFEIDEETNIEYSYYVTGLLRITDESNTNVYFEKEYNLLRLKSHEIESQDRFQIKETIPIDYDEYNRLANDFKMSYGVDTTSSLVVTLKINKKNSDETKDIKLNDTSDMSITIPLSEKSINIKMDYQEVNGSKNLVSKSEVVMNNLVDLNIAIILGILFLIMLYRIIKLLSYLRVKKSNYDVYVNKLLSEYDRLIVETSNCPDFTGLNIIKIKKFQELLDVRDNLKMPVMYYVVAPHHKCYFYIKHDTTVYLTTIKAPDLEDNNEKKI